MTITERLQDIAMHVPPHAVLVAICVLGLGLLAVLIAGAKKLPLQAAPASFRRSRCG